jgi:hypothetical protein
VLARERVITGLREQRDRDWFLPKAAVRAAAADLGCSPRSVRRRLRNGLRVVRGEAVSLRDDGMRAAYVRWRRPNASVAPAGSV